MAKLVKADTTKRKAAAKPKRAMVQPTKDELRTRIEKLEAAAVKLKFERKQAKGLLKEAREQIAELEADEKRRQAWAKDAEDEQDQEIEKLKARVKTEVDGRLRAEAQLRMVSQSSSGAASAIHEQLERCKQAVEKYKGAAESMAEQNLQLRAKLKSIEQLNRPGFPGGSSS